MNYKKFKITLFLDQNAVLKAKLIKSIYFLYSKSSKMNFLFSKF
ncbi:hypothetical protein MG1601_731 [Mycoplasmoides gallisepticum]|uniref:Uncharacterized protein n=1 Tax=Mycoplasmoides gallisepticum TaxID=2096 RepID=A0A3B0PGK4_MYCGL|nr:Uncharacterised protein [Mycoplasmoides gallisepticum]